MSTTTQEAQMQAEAQTEQTDEQQDSARFECDSCGERFVDGITAGNHEAENGHRVSWCR